MDITLIEMSQVKSRKRIKIKGYYMQVRQRSTKKGSKGTILGKWQPTKGKKRSYSCKLPINERLVRTLFCTHKKAGLYCSQSVKSSSCPYLTITYH